MDQPARPKVGVTVLIFKDGKVLLGLRKGDGRTDGMYGTPGGHLEHFERFEEGARREVAEEVGIETENYQPLGVSNVRHPTMAHYVMILLKADWKSGEPAILEPDKCEGWGWYDVYDPPPSLTPATRDAIRAYREGRMFFEG